MGFLLDMKTRTLLNIIGVLLLLGGTVGRFYEPTNRYALVCAIAGLAMVLLITLRATLRRKK